MFKDNIDTEIKNISGSLDKDLQDLIERSYLMREELCSIISSLLLDFPWVEIIKDSIDEYIEFPSVYFTSKTRNGSKKSYSILRPKFDGSFYIYLNSSKEGNEILLEKIKQIIKSPMVKNKVTDIKKNSLEISNFLKSK